MKYTQKSILSVGCLALALTTTWAADWPEFRGPQRNGISSEIAWSHSWPEAGPKQLWSAKVGIGYSGLSIAGGKLYTLGNENDKDTLWCLDAQSGAEVWRYTYDSPLDPKYYPGGPSSTPTVRDGAVYILSKAGLAQCLDAETGKLRWQRDVVAAGTTRPKWGYASSALIIDNIVYFNVGKNGMALQASDGSAVWNSGVGTSGYASPVQFTRGDISMLAMFGETALSGVEQKTGNVVWTIPWKTNFGENTPDPIIIDNHIFVSTGHGLGSSLFTLPTTGEPQEVWNNKELGNHLASSVVYKDHIYGFNGRVNKKDGHLGCLEIATGKQLWSTAVRGSLILAGDRLVILSLSGELIIAEANPSAYKELARAQIIGDKIWTTPTLCNGLVYARNAKGQIVCVQLPQ